MFKEYKGLRKEVYVLFISKIATAMGGMFWCVLTTALSIKLHMSASQIANWLVAGAIVNLPMQLIGGKLADKYDKKKILIYTDIIEVFGYLYCFIVPFSINSVLALFITSAIENLSNSSYSSLLADLTKSDDRTRANSLLYLGTNLGLVFGPALSGILVKYNINILFLIAFIATLISLVIEIKYLRNIEAIVDDTNKYEAPKKGNIFEIMKQNKIVMYFIILFSLEGLAYGEWSFIMPLDLITAFGENGSVYYGIMCSLNSIVVVLCTNTLTKLTLKNSDITRFILGVTGMGVGYTVFALFTNSIVLDFIAIVIFTLGEILMTISSDPIITKRIPMTHRGRMLSIYGVMGSTIYALGQKPISAIYDSKGASATWIVIISLTLFITIAFTLLKNKDKQTYPDLYKK